MKSGVVGFKPHPENCRTAPPFMVTFEKDFGVEKTRLVDYY
ncbi:MAG: hypothetical protein ACI85Q_002106 [Salibacteraceae bacterium]|jgi:hypothetical protein